MATKFQASVALQVRLPVDIREKLEETKNETGKSINSLMLEAIESYLKDKSVPA